METMIESSIGSALTVVVAMDTTDTTTMCLGTHAEALSLDWTGHMRSGRGVGGADCGEERRGRRSGRGWPAQIDPARFHLRIDREPN